MFGKLLRDVAGIADDVVTVAALPVSLAATITRELTQPLADAARGASRAVADDARASDRPTVTP